VRRVSCTFGKLRGIVPLDFVKTGGNMEHGAMKVENGKEKSGSKSGRKSQERGRRRTRVGRRRRCKAVVWEEGRGEKAGQEEA